MKLATLFICVVAEMLFSPARLLPYSQNVESQVQPIVQNDRSPLRVTGIVTAKDQGSGVLRYSLQKELVGTNLSKKTILLVILQLKMVDMSVSDSDNTLEDDYFFGPNVLAPDASKAFDGIIGPFGKPVGPGVIDRSKEPQATATVVFLQFADGSVWGNRSRAEHILRLRSELWNRLKSLSGTYQAKGQKEFVARLLEPTDVAVLRNLQNMYAENPKQNTKIVLDKVNGMLHYADLHQRSLGGSV